MREPDCACFLLGDCTSALIARNAGHLSADGRQDQQLFPWKRPSAERTIVFTYKLSQKRLSREFSIASIPDQCAGQLQESEVVFRLLVVANKNAAALAQPGERSFHDPAARLASTASTAARLLADGADVRRVVVLGCGFATGGIIVALVQKQMLFLSLGTLDDHRGQQVFQARRVVPVGRRRGDA